MATLADPGVVLRSDRAEPRFYVGLALTCLAVAVVGFAPTYWMPLFRGRLDQPLVLHLHALIFHGWLVFFVLQAWLASTGRLDRHRRMGLAGVSLATAMVFIGLEVAVAMLQISVAAGNEGARAFSVVPLSGILVFGGLVAVSIAYTAWNPEVHKRLMVVATAGILNAAVGRIFRMFLAPAGPPLGSPPPTRALLPGLVADLIVVAAMIHDYRTRGRVHPAYWIGLSVLLLNQFLRGLLGPSDTWLAFTRWLAG